MEYRTVRTFSKLPDATSVSRLAIALGAARGDLPTALGIANGWAMTPEVAKALEREIKGVVPAGSTTNGTWAGALTDLGVSAEAINVLHAMSAFGAMIARGTMQRMPFNVSVPRQTGSGAAGGRVPEGAPTPMVTLSYDTALLEPAKFQTFTAVSRELVKVGADGATEAALRQALLGGLAQAIDLALLDPTIPGSLTENAVVVTSTGSTPAQIATDLGSMLAALTPSASSPAWIARPTTAARIALALGAASDVPRSLLGLPLIVSGNSPQQVTLLDLASVGYADDGAFALEYSTNAAVQLDTNPSNSGVSGSPEAPTATALVSAWQSNLAIFRLTRWLNFTVLREDAVVYMTVTY